MTMPRRLAACASLLALLLAAACTRPPAGAAAQTPVQRGSHLAVIGGCHDCHTPKVFTEAGPQPDGARLLAGHPANAPVPAVPAGALTPDGWAALTNAHLTAWAGPWGVSFAANLTPHATGLGSWTEKDFIAAMRTGKHAGVGRPILPPMPWFNIAQMPDDDLGALFAYLRSLPAIDNPVPEPQPPPATPPPPPPG